MSQMFPEGYYTGTIKSLAMITSRQKGTPGVELEIEVEGHKRRVQWYFSGKAEEYTIEKMRRIGANLDTDPPSFSEESFEWSCRHETSDGKTFERWDIGAPAREVKPMDSDRLRLIKAKLASKQPGKPSTPPPPVPKATPSKPPPKGPPKLAAKVFKDADEAWAYVVELHGDGDRTAKEWSRSLAEVEAKTGKSSDDFLSENWKAVVDGLLPF